MRQVVSVMCAMMWTLGSAAAQQAADNPHPNMLSADEQAQGFHLLFDGKTTNGWRGFRKATIPDGWRVVDGSLSRVAAGGDIVTEEQFENFELRLEWRIAPGGNSGIMFHVTEDLEESYYSGPEMQVLDDAAHGDGISPLTSAGANYALHPAPRGIVRPAGSWNQVRLIVNGAHVEHWLNGTKIVEYELWSPDWESRVKQSKFVEWPEYGRAKRGHIALQDHGDSVSYRSIRIRVLP